jgi:hypothetical protein
MKPRVSTFESVARRDRERQRARSEWGAVPTLNYFLGFGAPCGG